MKKILLILLGLVMGTAVYAQDDMVQNDAGPDIGLTGESSRDRLVVELTFDNWFHKLGPEIETEWYSRGFNAYLLYDIKLGESLFSIAPGAGVSTSGIFYNAKIVQTEEGAELQVLEDSTGFEVKKNKLALTYIDIPVELRFRSKPNKKGKSFKMALGFKAGLLVDSHTKIKAQLIGATKTFKEDNILNLNKFRYGPTFRIGYGVINMVAYYSLAELFSEDKGPEITPFSIGISLNAL